MCEVKGLRSEAEAKASLNRASEYMGADPKPKRSIHGQVEAGVTPGGGPNRCGLKTARMSCG